MLSVRKKCLKNCDAQADVDCSNKYVHPSIDQSGTKVKTMQQNYTV